MHLAIKKLGVFSFNKVVQYTILPQFNYNFSNKILFPFEAFQQKILFWFHEIDRPQ